MRWFDKYKGLVRRFRIGYFIANLINYKTLGRSKEIYERFGLKRSPLRPLSNEILSGSNLKDIEHSVYVDTQSTHFGIDLNELRRQFDEDGFAILPSIFREEADWITDEIDNLLNSGKLGYNFTGIKMVFANRYSEKIRTFIANSALIDLLSDLLRWEVHPFQTINFKFGSEQAAHSDSIHMSTYPEGKLTAAWIALEDIGEDQGPLFYYPGSHKLPYTYNRDLGLEENFVLLDSNPNKKYEEFVSRLLEKHKFEKRIFHAKKGDVLIWHPNLLHGGMQQNNRSKTRNSMVIHYFGKGAICYHELTQRPAIIA